MQHCKHNERATCSCYSFIFYHVLLVMNGSPTVLRRLSYKVIIPWIPKVFTVHVLINVVNVAGCRDFCDVTEEVGWVRNCTSQKVHLTNCDSLHVHVSTVAIRRTVSEVYRSSSMAMRCSAIVPLKQPTPIHLRGHDTTWQLCQPPINFLRHLLRLLALIPSRNTLRLQFRTIDIAI
jgi:hypothetical protein